jgi:CheY-like chemotaxis protein
VRDDDHDPAPARILIVEDEALVRLLAAEDLRALGHEVEEAGDAAEALAAVAAAPDGAGFDAAVVDLGLPDRPGEDLVRELRRLRPGLKVLVATGYGEADLARRFGGEQAPAMLSKPYDVTDLRAALRGLLAAGGC